MAQLTEAAGLKSHSPSAGSNPVPGTSPHDPLRVAPQLRRTVDKKRETLELIRVAGVALISTGLGLVKVVKDKQHPAVFGLGVATAMTALAESVKKFIDESGADQTESQK